METQYKKASLENHHFLGLKSSGGGENLFLFSKEKSLGIADK